MNRKQLLALRDDIQFALDQRQHSGEYNADSKHMILLLTSMLSMVDHALYIQRPKKK